MTEQLKTNLTQKQLDQLAELITFVEDDEGNIRIKDVKGNVCGDVKGSVLGDVWGNVLGNVKGSVLGDV